MPPFLLHALPPIEPPKGLFEQTLQAIQCARQRWLYQRLGLALVGFLGCVGYGLWNFEALRAGMAESTFFVFLRLAISDPDIILPHLTELFLGLIETLPLEALLLGTLSSLCLLGSCYLISSLRQRSSFSLYSFRH